MSKRSARTFEQEQERLIQTIIAARCETLKCPDCEWTVFAGECPDARDDGHCADFMPCYRAFERESIKAEDEVHRGVWVRVDKKH